MFDEGVEEGAEVGVVDDGRFVELVAQALVGDDVVLVAVNTDFFRALSSTDLCSSGFVALGVGFGLFDLMDACDEEAACFVAVLCLGFGFLHADFDACGFVEELDSGRDFVDILSARSLCGGNVLIDIVGPIDVDLDLFGFWEHGDGAGGSVDPALRFGRGDAFDGVDA